MRTRSLTFRGGLLIAALGLLIGAAAACGGGDGAEDDVEETIRNAVDQFIAGDVDAFLANFTDKGIRESFGDDFGTASREEIKSQLEQFGGRIELLNVSNIDVDGNAATAEIETVFRESDGAAAGIVERDRLSLINADGVWKADGEEELAVSIPDDVKTIRVEANEFAFAVNTDEIEDGNIAFDMENVGKQSHEMGVAKIPADADIEELLRSEEEEPEGVTFLGGISPVEPGDETNVVFSGELEPGRYVMACFLPDTSEGPDGTPHALKGMYKEFTVE